MIQFARAREGWLVVVMGGEMEMVVRGNHRKERRSEGKPGREGEEGGNEEEGGRSGSANIRSDEDPSANVNPPISGWGRGLGGSKGGRGGGIGVEGEEGGRIQSRGKGIW
jgi:hypothetical protein